MTKNVLLYVFSILLLYSCNPKPIIFKANDLKGVHKEMSIQEAEKLFENKFSNSKKRKENSESDFLVFPDKNPFEIELEVLNNKILNISILKGNYINENGFQIDSKLNEILRIEKNAKIQYDKDEKSNYIESQGVKYYFGMYLENEMSETQKDSLLKNAKDLIVNLIKL